MIYKEQPENFSPRFEVVSCFLDCNGEFLLLHRHDYKPQGGTWGVPAGKIEKGEQIEEAILREIEEETGYKASPLLLNNFNKLYVRYNDYDFVYHTFYLNLDYKPEIILEDGGHKDFKWVTPKDTLKMNLIQDLDECIKLFYNTRRDFLAACRDVPVGKFENLRFSS